MIPRLWLLFAGDFSKDDLVHLKMIRSYDTVLLAVCTSEAALDAARRLLVIPEEWRYYIAPADSLYEDP